MHPTGKRRLWLGRVALFLPLFAILAGAIWYAVYAWGAMEGPPMPTSGYVAMAAGIILSLIVGVGLMALLFYSQRHGYDEPAQRQKRDEGE